MNFGGRRECAAGAVQPVPLRVIQLHLVSSRPVWCARNFVATLLTVCVDHCRWTVAHRAFAGRWSSCTSRSAGRLSGRGPVGAGVHPRRAGGHHVRNRRRIESAEKLREIADLLRGLRAVDVLADAEFDPEADCDGRPGELRLTSSVPHQR
jgi:hypothetical protein